MPSISPRLRRPRAKRLLKTKVESASYHNLYDWSWRKASKRFLQENPLCVCEECKKRVVARPAEVTDHKIPHKGDKALFWKRSNWQPMAKKCHDRKTVLEDGGFGNNN